MLALAFMGLMASAPQSLAVVPVVLGGSDGITPSELYNAASDSTRERMELRLLTREEIFVASREGLAKRIQDCGTAVPCLASRLRTLDASLGLLLILNADLDPPLVSLRLLDTDKRTQLGSETIELASNSAGELSKVRQAVASMLKSAGFAASGRVLVQVTPPDAVIMWADGRQPDTGTPNVFTVPPGTYTISGAAEDHDTAESQVTVKAGEETTVSLQLEEKKSIASSPLLWIGVGAAALAAGGVAVWAGTRSPSRGLCVILTEGMDDACP